MSFFSDKTCHPRLILHYLLGLVRTLFEPSPTSRLLSIKTDSTATVATHEYTFELYNRVADLPVGWNNLVEEEDLFLQASYLQVLEASPPKGMELRFLLLKQEGKPVGAVLLQLIDYALQDSLKGLEEAKQKTWREWLRYKVASVLNFKVLVVGNLLLSGDHAYYFDPKSLSESEGLKLIAKSLAGINQQLTRQKEKTSGVLFKDSLSDSLPLKEHGYFHQLTFQPNMVFTLDSAWTKMEDYLDSLQSKYRVRAKRAFKKGKEISRTEWSLKDIRIHKQEIFDLYLAIADKAEFNIVNLTIDYIPALKESLQDHFRLFAYHDPAGRFIGFNTLIQNGRAYDAHFLGLEEASNRSHQLYLNMLLDMVRHSIEKEDVDEIVFGRTALEIKSSIGAKPEQMYCYAQHFNPVFNLLIGWLIRKFDPKIEWTPRHPFKEVGSE